MGLVLLVLVAVAAVLGRHIQTYRPLGFIGGEVSTYAGSGPGDPVNTTDVQRNRTHNFPEEVQIRFRPGGRFTLRFHLGNKGPWGVRITDFPFDSGYVLLEDVRMGRGGPYRGPEKATDFRPFVLEPEQSRLIELHFRFLDCDLHPGFRDPLGGLFVSWSEQRVEYRIFGIPRHMMFELPEAVAVNIGAGGDCSS